MRWFILLLAACGSDPGDTDTASTTDTTTRPTSPTGTPTGTEPTTTSWSTSTPALPPVLPEGVLAWVTGETGDYELQQWSGEGWEDRTTLLALPPNGMPSVDVDDGYAWVVGFDAQSVALADGAYASWGVETEGFVDDVDLCGGQVWFSDTVDDQLRAYDPTTGEIAHEVDLAAYADHTSTLILHLAEADGSLFLGLTFQGLVLEVDCEAGQIVGSWSLGPDPVVRPDEGSPGHVLALASDGALYRLAPGVTEATLLRGPETIEEATGASIRWLDVATGAEGGLVFLTDHVVDLPSNHYSYNVVTCIHPTTGARTDTTLPSAGGRSLDAARGEAWFRVGPDTEVHPVSVWDVDACVERWTLEPGVIVRQLVRY